MAGKTQNGANGKLNGWEIDLNGIKRGEADAFNAAFKQGQETNDDSCLFVWYAKVVKKWPYEGDPTNPESYPELGLLDYAEAMACIGAAFRAVRDAARKARESGDSGSQGSAAGVSEGADE